MTTTTDLATVFAGLTSASPLPLLCAAAMVAAGRAARSDLREAVGVTALASDAATIAYLADPETRGALEAWIASYRHDEETLAALSSEAAAEVLASAWLHYQATVMQARDEARSAFAAAQRVATPWRAFRGRRIP